MAANKTDRLADIAAGRCRVGIALSEAIGARLDAGISVSAIDSTVKALFALDAMAYAYLVNGPNQSLYWVDSKDPGLTRTLLTTIDKTGLSASLNSIRQKPVLIADAPEVLQTGLDAGRMAQAADSLGAAQCMLDQAVVYAGQREQFNRVIASFQAVKHMCRRNGVSARALPGACLVRRACAYRKAMTMHA